jgi:hypothetical protein
VRPIGRTPTAFVDSVEKIRRLKQDHAKNLYEIDLSDGRRVAFSLHLFTAPELQNYFASCFDIEDLRRLDLFHSRFIPNARWNPTCSTAGDQLVDELVRLEEDYATKPGLIDRAAHLLLVGRKRYAAVET